jgi:hypothetical protein
MSKLLLAAFLAICFALATLQAALTGSPLGLTAVYGAFTAVLLLLAVAFWKKSRA